MESLRSEQESKMMYVEKKEPSHSFFHISLLVLAFYFSAVCGVYSSSEGEAARLAEKYRQEGYALVQDNKLEEGLRAYLKAAYIYPSYAPVYNDIGIIYAALLDFDNAEDAYLEAISIDPDYMPAYYNLALSYEKKGYYKRAALFLRERIKRAKGQNLWVERAQKLLNEMVEYYPGVSEYLVRLEAEDYRNELMYKIQKRLHEDEKRARLLFEGSQREYEKGKLDVASEYLQKALVLDFDNPHLEEQIKSFWRAINSMQAKKRTEEAYRKLDLLSCGK